MQSKYVNPFTDFGFKKLFGEEASKPALIDFLNALLPNHPDIINISFKNPEVLGDGPIDRKAIYDIYCENENGEKFIVELQKAKQNYFKERTIYYSTYPIREQAEKGQWNFNLKAVFCIGILDFIFDEDPARLMQKEVVREIKLRDKDGVTFYEKLTYIYLEMPNFTKSEDQLESRLDKWLYFIKHLEDFDTIPEIFKNDIVFTSSFSKAALAALNEDEKMGYEYSLKVYRDNINVVDFALQEGTRKGIEIGIDQGIEIGEANKQKYAEEYAEKKMKEFARNCKANGMSIETIAKLTGLSEQEVAGILN